MKAPTTDQLRDRIDRGITGEKVPMPDPAAAPMGTDAEAAGQPPTEQERAMDAQAAPVHPPQKQSWGGFAVYIGIAAAIAVVFAFVVVLAL
jgi:hypothetical protein